MLFIYNANGNLITYVPEQVNQSSNNANQFYVIAPLSEANQVLADFTLPNGNVVYPVYASNSNGLTNLINVQIEGTTYSVWEGTLSDVITAMPGTVNVQFKFINETQVITTQSVNFDISAGASAYEPLDSTANNTLEEIVGKINALINERNNFENGINNKFSELQTELEQLIAQGVSDYNNLNNKPIINADLTAILSPQTEYYRHSGETTAEFVHGAIYYYNGTTFSQVSTNSYVDGKIDTVNQRIDALQSVSFVKVDTLPTASAQTLGKIYLVPADNAEAPNIYNEYITIEENGVYSWEIIGNTEIDLSGKTAVTVGGVVQETWNADTKLDKVTDNEPGGLSRVYAVRHTGEQRMIIANPNEGINQLVQRDSNGRARVNEPVHEKDIANKKYVDTVSKYYSHKITISSLTLTGSVYLQVLSRQPNMYTSLADMVADTALILPNVGYWNETGEQKGACEFSITNTSISWVSLNSAGSQKTINTTDDSYSFVDSVKAYEIPTT